MRTAPSTASHSDWRIGSRMFHLLGGRSQSVPGVASQGKLV
jgi:hypothetical protein